MLNVPKKLRCSATPSSVSGDAIMDQQNVDWVNRSTSAATMTG